MASEYDIVVVFCGNNNLSQQPFKPSLKAESPLQVATSLCSFKHELELRNPYINVKIIRLLLRPDVDRVVVQSTNSILYETLNFSYVSPREIELQNHFEGDGVHLNVEHGIYHARRTFKRIIQSVV